MPEGTIQAAQHCPRCLGKLRIGSKFCSSCGAVFDVSTAVPERNEQKRSGSDFVLHWAEIKQVGYLFGLMLLSSLVLGWVVRINSSPIPQAIMSGVDALVVLVFVGLRYKDILPLLVLPRLSLRIGIKLSIVALVFVALMEIYFTLIARVGVPLFRVATTYEKAGWGIGLMLVFVSFLPAVVEELAFRGVIQTMLTHVLGNREAWIIQAALFSVLHLLPMMFPSHFIMGLCFGYMRLKSKNLYPGMVLHASWNALVLYQEIY